MRYIDLGLSGSGHEALGFVEGLRLGSREASPVWFLGREKVDYQGFIEKLRAKLSLETHMVVSETFAQAIETALAATPLIALEVASKRVVDSAHLEFTFECFSKEVAEELRRVFEADLPDGLLLENYDAKEIFDEGSRGVELYSPSHEYVFSGGGRYIGSVAAILDIAHRIADHDFVHTEGIHLNHA